MNDNLTERLNVVLEKLISDDLINGRGLGNEIAFYIFDYPPEEELRIRDHIEFLLKQIPMHMPELRVIHVDLFDMVLDHMRSRNLLEPSYKLQRDKGDEALVKALKAPLKEDKLAQVFKEVARPDDHDLVLVSGIGGVYPMLRSHSLLNNLHAVMGLKPLVMFFPGRYDGQSLSLFGELSDNNYYRAFKLVP
ncbi:DUF1788 domain-containing protein [Magnetovibrio blakemorei]|uniref:Cytoplasmic protein n=1 Tax=Magnetovibrio blakemorei TaxID=28181 RepID=A0A1E5Q474_9PROT|nr:DUF1788 domain-containing protein [Magnetovibrio blakemorei]OEJ64564.1 cytoplasmic protein [Magnetovibrio blakemorei]